MSEELLDWLLSDDPEERLLREETLLPDELLDWLLTDEPEERLLREEPLLPDELLDRLLTEEPLLPDELLEWLLKEDSLLPEKLLDEGSGSGIPQWGLTLAKGLLLRLSEFLPAFARRRQGN